MVLSRFILMLRSLSLSPIAFPSPSLLYVTLCHCFNHSPSFIYSSSLVWNTP